MPIPNKPVWSFAPNWAQGITEHMSFLTDVLISSTGAEQRRAVRLSPRIGLEMTFNPKDNVRAFMDLFLNRLGAKECYFPLWYDKSKIALAAPAAATVLTFDTTFREYAAGGFALLYFDAFNYEAVQIQAVTNFGITLVDPLAKAWPKGTVIYPLRTATVIGDATHSALVASVGQAQLLFTLTGANLFPATLDTGMVYGGLPVITVAPDRANSLDMTYQRQVYERDNQTGKRYRKDDAGRAFPVQVHNWQVKGKEARYALRSLLYGLNGRQKTVWVPTFNDDFTLATAAVAGQTTVNVFEMGLAYTGVPAAGRDHIYIGSEIVEINNISNVHGVGQERIILKTPLAASYPAGTTASWIDTGRQDQDDIEITHHADSDGAMEVTSAFRCFRNSRDASGVNFLPIPTTAQGIDPCGEPAPDEASDCAPPNPCPPYPIIMQWSVAGNCNPAAEPFWFIRAPGGPAGNGNYQPNPPVVLYNDAHPDGFVSEGNLIGNLFSFGSPTPIYEKDTRGTDKFDERLQGRLLFSIDRSTLSDGRMSFFFPIGGHWKATVQYYFNYCPDDGPKANFQFFMCRTGGRAPNCACDMTPVGSVAIGGEVFGHDIEWDF